MAEPKGKKSGKRTGKAAPASKRAPPRTPPTKAKTPSRTPPAKAKKASAAARTPGPKPTAKSASKTTSNAASKAPTRAVPAGKTIVIDHDLDEHPTGGLEPEVDHRDEPDEEDEEDQTREEARAASGPTATGAPPMPAVTMRERGAQVESDAEHGGAGDWAGGGSIASESMPGGIVAMVGKSPGSRPATEGALLHPTSRARTGPSLPEQFLMLVVDPGWDSRQEKHPDGLGIALAGSILLDLGFHGNLQLHTNRFKVEDPGDAAFAPTVAELQRKATRDAGAVLQGLGKRASRLADPFKDRLARSGVLNVRRTRVLGLFPRSALDVANEVALERYRSRVMRGLAGGGPLEAQEILLLGLIDAAGLLEQFVPASAVAYNRKRIQGLLAGRDRLDYRTDQGLRAIQKDLVDFVLRAVRQARR